MEAPSVEDGDKILPPEPGNLQVAIRAFHYPASAGPVLSLIQRHFDIQQDDIRYHQIPLPQLRLDSWRSRLAVVSQTPFLFSDKQHCAGQT